MNIIQALAHHLNQHTPHKWEATTNQAHALIHSHHTTTYIQITQNDNTLELRHTHYPDTHTHQQTTTHIDLLDPHFLPKIHQAITHHVFQKE